MWACPCPSSGAGIALQHATFKVTLLALSIAVTAGMLVASRYLLRLPTTRHDASAGEY